MTNSHLLHLKIALLGLMSGFAVMISGSTLNFWLSSEKLDVETIGIFSLILVPYAINFLWAPIFDTIKLPILRSYLGQRISWLIILQISLSVMVYCLSLVLPKENIWLFGFIGLLVSFFASAQDAVLGALRTEIVTPHKQGSVSGVYVFGYRSGMFFSGYVAIYCSEYTDFRNIYEWFSCIILLFPCILIVSYNKLDLEVTNRLLAKPDFGSNFLEDFGAQGHDVLDIHQDASTQPRQQVPAGLGLHNKCNNGRYEITSPIKGVWPRNHYILGKSRLMRKLYFSNPINFLKNILNPVGSIYFIVMVLVFLVTYRLPDNFIVTMINPFLLKLGYTAIEIATVGKLFGLISALIGGLIASYIMKHKDILDSLICFGGLHAASHLLFVLQEYYGKNIPMLYIVIGFEGTTSGMVMAAYIGFIASLCHGKFRATQYSFFSSMMGFSRAILPSISGYCVSIFGWDIFFIFTTLAAIPPLFIAIYLKQLRN